MRVRNHLPPSVVIMDSHVILTIYNRLDQHFDILLDLDSWEWLKDYTIDMMSNGYARVTDANGVRWLLHRVVIDAPESYMVDHINHNRLDNRKANLRICDRSQNQHNRSNLERGVSYHTKRKKWDARCKINNKVHFIGLYDKKEDAIEALKSFRAIHQPFSPEARN